MEVEVLVVVDGSIDVDVLEMTIGGWGSVADFFVVVDDVDAGVDEDIDDVVGKAVDDGKIDVVDDLTDDVDGEIIGVVVDVDIGEDVAVEGVDIDNVDNDNADEVWSVLAGFGDSTVELPIWFVDVRIVLLDEEIKGAERDVDNETTLDVESVIVVGGVGVGVGIGVGLWVWLEDELIETIKEQRVMNVSLKKGCNSLIEDDCVSMQIKLMKPYLQL